MPPIKGNAKSSVNNFIIILINTFSAEPAASVPKITGIRYARPITPTALANPNEMATHTMPITLDFLNSFSELIAMNLVRM